MLLKYPANKTGPHQKGYLVENLSSAEAENSGDPKTQSTRLLSNGCLCPGGGVGEELREEGPGRS